MDQFTVFFHSIESRTSCLREKNAITKVSSSGHLVNGRQQLCRESNYNFIQTFFDCSVLKTTN